MAEPGETADEVVEGVDDLRAADADILAIGQDLQRLPPTRHHLRVEEDDLPEEVERFRAEGLRRGPSRGEFGPPVPSSCHAGERLTAAGGLPAPAGDKPSPAGHEVPV